MLSCAWSLVFPSCFLFSVFRVKFLFFIFIYSFPNSKRVGVIHSGGLKLMRIIYLSLVWFLVFPSHCLLTVFRIKFLFFIFVYSFPNSKRVGVTHCGGLKLMRLVNFWFIWSLVFPSRCLFSVFRLSFLFSCLLIFL